MTQLSFWAMKPVALLAVAMNVFACHGPGNQLGNVHEDSSSNSAYGDTSSDGPVDTAKETAWQDTPTSTASADSTHFNDDTNEAAIDTTTLIQDACGRAICDSPPIFSGPLLPSSSLDLDAKPSCPDSPWRQLFPERISESVFQLAGASAKDFWVLTEQGLVHMSNGAAVQHRLEGLSIFRLVQTGAGHLIAVGMDLESFRFSLLLLTEDGQFMDITPPLAGFIMQVSWTNCGKLVVLDMNSVEWSYTAMNKWSGRKLPLSPMGEPVFATWHTDSGIVYGLANYCRSGSIRFPQTYCYTTMYQLMGDSWQIVESFPFLDRGYPYSPGECYGFVMDKKGDLFLICEWGVMAIDENGIRDFAVPTIPTDGSGRRWTSVFGGCAETRYAFSVDPSEVYRVRSNTATKVQLPEGINPSAGMMLGDEDFLLGSEEGALITVEDGVVTSSTLPTGVGWRAASTDLHGHWHVVGERGILMSGQVQAPRVTSLGANVSLTSVFAWSAQDLVVGGTVVTSASLKESYLARFDGETWTTLGAGLACKRVNEVWGTADQTQVFAACHEGKIIHCKGSECVLRQHGDKDWLSVWGNSPKDVFFAGKAGTLAHFDGQVFSDRNSSLAEDVISVRSADSSELVLLTSERTLWRRDEQEWREIFLPPISETGVLLAINTPLPGEIYALFSRAVGHYDGEEWRFVLLGSHATKVTAFTINNDGLVTLFGWDGLVLESSCLSGFSKKQAPVWRT